MKNILVGILILLIMSMHSIARQTRSNSNVQTQPFSSIVVKKNTNGKICDSCKVDFALNLSSDFSFLITGSRHTPDRLSMKRTGSKYASSYAKGNEVFFFSSGHIGITFLPNYLFENGKRLQILRNYSGPVYSELEFQVKHNKSMIINWRPLLSLKDDKDYTILGTVEDSENAMMTPWKRTFHAGNFNMAVNDSIYITLRNISTKKVLKKIVIIRALDKATNFWYYQIPLSNAQFGVNLQNILNLHTNSFKVYRGDTINVFEKDYNSIGILRFAQLNENEEIEYSFGNNPFNWQSVKTRDPKTGIFLVIPGDMPDGENHDIFLRYKSQPETIHSITIKVKQRPFQFPWITLTISCMVILVTTIVFFYLREQRNKRKLLTLKKKNTETESHLALLSGQLNPHFLFNTLNAIQGTINSNNPDLANAYIAKVASFMRDVMDNGQKEFVSLKEELKLELDYLRLEQQRITFNHVITISPELETLLIDFPPLLLQPVLENSIRHAFGSEHSNPTIKIDIRKSDSTLIIEIADNGSSAWNIDKISEGHGLSLTRKRIAIYNEKLQYISILMDIKYQHQKGTITTFTLKNWLA